MAMASVRHVLPPRCFNLGILPALLLSKPPSERKKPLPVCHTARCLGGIQSLVEPLAYCREKGHDPAMSCSAKQTHDTAIHQSCRLFTGSTRVGNLVDLLHPALGPILSTHLQSRLTAAGLENQLKSPAPPAP